MRKPPARQRLGAVVETCARKWAVAKRLRAVADDEASRDPTGARLTRRDAADLEAQANALAVPPATLSVGRGGELEPLPELAQEEPWLTCTTDNPTLLTADASLKRLDLVEAAGCRSLALDAAETVQAQNSLEKMLTHQLAAAHVLAMRLTEKAGRELARVTDHTPAAQRQAASVEAARLSGAAARMMETYQRGVLALPRLRHGGKQVVVVQHVHVSGDAQAVVAGSVSGGRREG